MSFYHLDVILSFDCHSIIWIPFHHIQFILTIFHHLDIILSFPTHSYVISPFRCHSIIWISFDHSHFILTIFHHLDGILSFPTHSYIISSFRYHSLIRTSFYHFQFIRTIFHHLDVILSFLTHSNCPPPHTCIAWLFISFIPVIPMSFKSFLSQSIILICHSTSFWPHSLRPPWPFHKVWGKFMHPEVRLG